MTSTHPPRTLRIAIVVGVVAFALGAAGTATAGPALTAGAVKKIAAKAVAKAAPDLSVKHAASADTASSSTNADHAANADKVGGKSVAELGSKVFVYSIVQKTAAAHQEFTFTGLPAGTYAVAISLFGTVAPPDDGSECDVMAHISAPASPQARVKGIGAKAVGAPFVVGSGVLTVAAADDPGMQCLPGDSSSETVDGHGGTVTFTRIDAVTITNAG